MSNKNLVKHLKNRGILRSESIEKALLYVDRKDFIPEKYSDYAYVDDALPIGRGQTISQPYTVTFMLELLNVFPGDVVMEVGYGSGWVTALLSHLVGEKGRVYSFEIVPELCDVGETNLKKYPKLLKRSELFCKSAKNGIPNTKLDRILVSADVRSVPKVWRNQLKINGVMVYPQRWNIVREEKTYKNDFKREEHGSFAFVPFVED
ncbi:protein-L-isoaspartate O-methyltransferase [Patescibacteria group bacterium]